VRRKNGSSTTESDILDLLDESVIERGLDGRVLHWNAASERLYGWSRADAAGCVADDLLRTSGGPIANLQRLLDGGAPEANVARVTADGKQITVTIRWHLRRDARGRPADIVETGLVRAAKTDTATLEGSDQRYRTLLHFVPFALVQFDRTELAGVFETLKSRGVRDLSHYVETHPDFVDYALNSIKVIEVNRQTVQLFGACDAAQLLGPATRIWSEARETFRRSMQARFEGAARFEAEIRIRTFHDEIVDVLYVTDFPEALRHEALGLACLIDIRDRVKAQAMLARVQAEFAHAARVSMLGELTASIAHEVNQPLGAILTNGEAALRWLDRPEPDLDELRALSTRAVADARRAADVIDRIRAMAVRTEPTYAAASLRGVVEDVMMFLRPELRRQNVEALLELAPDLPDVFADRVQLQQVLANLAVNAMQAMAQPGRSLRRLTICTARVDARTVSAEVEDSGPGIAAGHMDRLFQSFFTTKDGGMGIGLAICRSIIEAHGGSIRATNLSDGRGARFHFTLPVCQPGT
jgi:C4-dicarboxylate-specific signal transduction histidine kinase